MSILLHDHNICPLFQSVGLANYPELKALDFDVGINWRQRLVVGETTCFDCPWKQNERVVAMRNLQEEIDYQTRLPELYSDQQVDSGVDHFNNVIERLLTMVERRQAQKESTARKRPSASGCDIQTKRRRQDSN